MFQPGDVVVCINDEFRPNEWAFAEAHGHRFPVKGKVYTIRALTHSPRGNPCFLLHELRNPKIKYADWPVPLEVGFRRDRFRKAMETDISVFEKMLVVERA